jgi:hypothetical protein
MKKRWFIVPVLVGVLALGILTASVVMAQEPPANGGSPFESFATRVARILGIEEPRVLDAFAQAKSEMASEAFQERMAKLVERGEITQEQADEAIAWFESRPEGVPLGIGFMCRHGHGFHRGGFDGGIEEKLARAVERGLLTQEQADEYLAWYESKPDFLDQGFGPGWHFRGHGPRMPFPGFGPDEAAPEESNPATPSSVL